MTQKLSGARYALFQFLYKVMQTIIFVFIRPLHLLLVAVLLLFGVSGHCYGQLKSCLMEKDLRVLIYSQMNTSQDVPRWTGKPISSCPV